MDSVVKKLKIWALTACVCLTASLALASEADAYAYDTCNGEPVTWDGASSRTFIIRTSHYDPNDPAHADVEEMMDRWNSIRGMWNIFDYQDDDACCIQAGDDENDVYQMSDSEIDGNTGQAIIITDGCTWAWSEEHIVEVDVATNQHKPWIYGDPACDVHRAEGDDPEIQQTLAHEFGHAVGLNHNQSEPALMHESGEGRVSACYDRAMSPNPDDAGGGRFLQGSGNTSTNIYATSFTWDSSENEARFNNSSTTMFACPGDTVTVDWTVANNGTEDVTFDVGWYLSTNNNITTYDILAESGYGAMQSGESFPGTFDETFTVPSSVSYDTTYYVGTYADFNNQVTQRFSSDDATYEAIKIYIRQSQYC